MGRAARPVEIAILALPENDEQRRVGSVAGGGGDKGRRHRFIRAATGQAGEIATKGPHLMRGYWRRPAATAASLVAAEGRGEEGLWLRTGDVGRVDAEGRLWFQGRMADVIRCVAPVNVCGVSAGMVGPR